MDIATARFAGVAMTIWGGLVARDPNRELSLEGGLSEIRGRLVFSCYFNSHLPLFGGVSSKYADERWPD